MIEIPGHIKSLKPYVAGKTIAELMREKKISRVVKLASNENPLGPSPLALKAAAESLQEAHRYTEPWTPGLVSAIAKRYGLKQNEIICGAGTDSLLAYIIQAFSDNDDELLTANGTFIGIYVNARKQNRRLRRIDLHDDTYNLGGIAGAISPRTRIIYLANPNNPTGTMFGRDEFEHFMERIPADRLVILDEAYSSYASENENYPNGLDYDFPNLIVTRTFSKDYGLAGFRVGFARARNELIEQLYKVKLPFEPSSIAQAAAIASLEDHSFLKDTVDLNRRMLKKMAERFASLGIEHPETAANFIMLRFPSEQIAASFNQGCLDRGLIVRHVKPFGIPEGVRINSGTEDETEFALEIIDEVTHELGAACLEAKPT